MKWVCTVLIVVFVAGSTASAFDFSDIEYWVGTGPNETAFVVDWDGDDLGYPDAPSLVWGYRWEGSAVAEDALRAIVADDDRLFVKLGESGGFGTPVYGIGYELNGDGSFALDDFTEFDEHGFAIDGPSYGGVAAELGDAYQEGFNDGGHWHLGITTTSMFDSWTSSGGGISITTLTDQLWIGLAFSSSSESTAFAYPTQPLPAPLSGLPGDFDESGRVDLLDYVYWRDFGLDGNLYLVWKQNIGALSSASSSTSATQLAIPEPAAVMTWLSVFVTVASWRRALGCVVSPSLPKCCKSFVT